MTVLQLIGGVRRAVRTALLRRQGGSDIGRWSSMASLDESWNERTALLAQWIAPGASVIEFGAGRRFLERVLPPGCDYTPSDLIDRGPKTFVCDLNAVTLPPFPAHDVAVLSGVLEYVHDVARVIRHLAPAATVVLVSYAVAAPDHRSTYSRRRHGWVNDFDELSLRRAFALYGYECQATSNWRAQRLFFFEQRSRSRDGLPRRVVSRA